MTIGSISTQLDWDGLFLLVAAFYYSIRAKYVLKAGSSRDKTYIAATLLWTVGILMAIIGDALAHEWAVTMVFAILLALMLKQPDVRKDLRKVMHWVSRSDRRARSDGKIPKS
jgi:hypothetical protein